MGGFSRLVKDCASGVQVLITDGASNVRLRQRSFHQHILHTVSIKPKTPNTGHPANTLDSQVSTLRDWMLNKVESSVNIQRIRLTTNRKRFRVKIPFLSARLAKDSLPAPSLTNRIRQERPSAISLFGRSPQNEWVCCAMYGTIKSII
jgi:hypothetical protein